MIRKKLREIKIAASQPGGLKRKIKYYQFAKLARKNGVIDFRVDRIAKDIFMITLIIRAKQRKQRNGDINVAFLHIN